MENNEKPKKGTLDYYKMKKSEANKRYREKMKNIEKDTKSDTQSEKSNFFFQKQQQPQIVINQPEISMMKQIQNQLIMGAIGLLPLIVTKLLTMSNKPSQTPLKKESPEPSEMLQMEPSLSFL